MQISHHTVILFILFTVIVGLKRSDDKELSTSWSGATSGSVGNSSCSIGQIAYINKIGTTGSVAQGVQKGVELSITTRQDEPNLNLYLSTFLSLSPDFLILQIDEFCPASFIYQFYAMNGKKLYQYLIAIGQLRIAMEFLAISAYFLKGIQNDKVVKTFRILKTK